jgi:hypothetical protein
MLMVRCARPREREACGWGSPDPPHRARTAVSRVTGSTLPRPARVASVSCDYTGAPVDYTPHGPALCLTPEKSLLIMQ